jgi:hypothetical protein
MAKADRASGRLQETDYGVQGWSANRLGKEVAIPVSTVTRALELLDLPTAVQDLVVTRSLASSTACEVGRLEDPEAMVELATQAVEQKLTNANVIEEVHAKRPPRAPKPAGGPNKPDPSHKVSPIEIILGQGRRVLVSGVPADAGPEATL